MTSQCTAQLLADLGVTRSLSRPQVSDDNPFSEAQFKTLKIVSRTVRGSGPRDVLSIVLPLVQCRAPPWRHLDANPRAGPLRSGRRIARRTTVLNTAWTAHPERFVRGLPKPKPLPEAVDQSSHLIPLHQEIAL